MKKLSDPNRNARWSSAWYLRVISFEGADTSVAMHALAEAVSDADMSVRIMAASALERAIQKCASAEALSVMEAKLRESYDILRSEYRHGKEAELAGIRVMFSKLMSEAAKRRDALVTKKDILLDDKLKPPKKGRGEIYCQMRRVRNG